MFNNRNSFTTLKFHYVRSYETIRCKRRWPHATVPRMFLQRRLSDAAGASTALLQLCGGLPGGGTCSGIDRWRTVQISRLVEGRIALSISGADLIYPRII